MNSTQDNHLSHRLEKSYGINFPKEHLMNTTPNNNTMNSDTQNALEEVEQMGFPKNRNKIILRIIRKFSLRLCAASRQRNAV